MSVYYYEPFFSFSDMNRLFSDASNGSGRSDRQVQSQGTSGPTVFQPRLDIHENKESNLVTATFELPGLNKDAISIDIHNNRLIVSGETTHSKDVNENGYVHRERRSGKFSRSLPLPSGIKATDVKASMENGVLTITFPKTAAEQAPQKITIA